MTDKFSFEFFIVVKMKERSILSNSLFQFHAGTTTGVTFFRDLDKLWGYFLVGKVPEIAGM